MERKSAAHTRSNGFDRLSWIFCALLLMALLAACNPEPSPTAETTPVRTRTPRTRSSATPQISLTPTPTGTPVSRIDLEHSDLHGVVIHFWHPWAGEAGEAMQELVEDFNLTNAWNIVVVPVAQAGLDAMFENVSAAISARDIPDVVVGYLHQALAWDEGRKLVDLRAYVDDPSWGLSPEEQADFYPAFWEQDVFEGKRLGVPALRSGKVLFYNRTWARELGFSVPPVAPQHFQQQACAAAKANQIDPIPENDGTGGWLIAGLDRPDFSAVLGWIYAFGGEVVVANPGPGAEESAYQFDSEEVEQAFTFLRGLYDEGCAWFGESQFTEAEFAERQALFATGSVMDIPYQVEAFRGAGNPDEWTVLPFPSESSQPVTDVFGPSYEVMISSPERQLASWVFIKWLLNPENQARMVEATGAFPLRETALEALGAYQGRNPQWAAAAALLPEARSEPRFQSWGTVRWALSDAATQLFRSYFSIEQVPDLVNLLDLTAAELHLGPDLEKVFATPIPTTTTPTP